MYFYDGRWVLVLGGAGAGAEPVTDMTHRQDAPPPPSQRAYNMFSFAPLIIIHIIHVSIRYYGLIYNIKYFNSICHQQIIVV